MTLTLVVIPTGGKTARCTNKRGRTVAEIVTVVFDKAGEPVVEGIFAANAGRPDWTEFTFEKASPNPLRRFLCAIELSAWWNSWNGLARM